MKCNRRTCSREAEDGLKSCRKCREYTKSYNKMKRASRDSSLCVYSDCPNRRDPGYSSCSRCRDRAKQCEDGKRPAMREKGNFHYYKTKDEVFAAYGGYSCACCRETHKEFLSIDHIDGDGPAHRKEMTGDPRNGQNLYYWLKKNGFPPGFRVLCLNCNFSLGHHGYCPHNNGLTQTCRTGRPVKEVVPTNGMPL